MLWDYGKKINLFGGIILVVRGSLWATWDYLLSKTQKLWTNQDFIDHPMIEIQVNQTTWCHPIYNDSILHHNRIHIERLSNRHINKFIAFEYPFHLSKHTEYSLSATSNQPNNLVHFREVVCPLRLQQLQSIDLFKNSDNKQYPITILRPQIFI